MYLVFVASVSIVENFVAKVDAEESMNKQREKQNSQLSAWQEQNPLLQWRRKQEPEGWNRSVVARKLGVSPAAVGTWEKGQRLPGIKAFAKIEKLTSITLAQWIAWHEKKPKEK